MYKDKNLPKSLIPVVEKWKRLNKKFYIDPRNIFKFNDRNISYLANPDIPTEVGSWYAFNQNIENDDVPSLTKDQIQDIALEMAKHFKIFRWAITVDHHCNYSCPMCPYNGDGFEDKAGQDYWKDRMSQKKTITKEEAFRIIDIVAENGITHINIFSSGELFVYKHWKEVTLYAKNKGMHIAIMTNGSLIDQSLCNSMKEAGIKDVRVSLDALSYKTYSKVRSSKKEFYQSAINAPVLLLDNGFNVNVHFVKQKENIHEAEEFISYWKERGVSSISIANQLVFKDGNSVDIFGDAKDPFIHGMCTRFGVFSNLTNGVVVACCEMTAQYTDITTHGLPEVSILNNSFKQCVETHVGLVSDINSPFRKICSNCPLYTIFVQEEYNGGWKVVKTHDRETWFKL
jgi:sulfatase maturation enzyme AslB (radical SAM superfamily)